MNPSDAHKLLQDLLVTEADILPDLKNKKLRVRVHNASRPAANRALYRLFEKLNQAKIKFPGTDYQVVYEFGGNA